jgi:hypothetical protein
VCLENILPKHIDGEDRKKVVASLVSISYRTSAIDQIPHQYVAALWAIFGSLYANG